MEGFHMYSYIHFYSFVSLFCGIATVHAMDNHRPPRINPELLSTASRFMANNGYLAEYVSPELVQWLAERYRAQHGEQGARVLNGHTGSVECLAYRPRWLTIGNRVI